MAGRNNTKSVRVEVLRQLWLSRTEFARVGEILMVDIDTARRLYTNKGAKPAPVVQSPVVQTQTPKATTQGPTGETQEPVVATQSIAPMTRNGQSNNKRR